jgi:hypothetical protein
MPLIRKLDAVLDPVTFLRLLGVVKTIQSADQVAGYASGTFKADSLANYYTLMQSLFRFFFPLGIHQHNIKLLLLSAYAISDPKANLKRMFDLVSGLSCLPPFCNSAPEHLKMLYARPRTRLFSLPGKN